MICTHCHNTYIPSRTSDPNRCGICLAFSAVKKARPRPEYTVNRKTPKNRDPSPLSWGILTGNTCQCPVCREVFETEIGFGMHRRKFKGEERYCLDPDQMRQIGMVLNTYGRWGTSLFNRQDVLESCGMKQINQRVKEKTP